MFGPLQKKHHRMFVAAIYESRLCCFIEMSAIVTLVEMEATWKWNEKIHQEIWSLE